MRPWPAITFPYTIRVLPWRRAIVCACFAGSLPGPAAAETFAAPSQASVVTPLSLTKTSDMVFGTIASPVAAGTVVLTPASTCTTTGGLVRTGTCQAAAFAGLGTANQVVKLNLPNYPITISNGAQSMSITGRTFDPGADLNHLSGNVNGNGAIRYRIVPANGIFTFRLGGTLNVGANQQAGVYTGTFSVSLDYQ
jgi:hypothetical protein